MSQHSSAQPASSLIQPVLLRPYVVSQLPAHVVSVVLLEMAHRPDCELLLLLLVYYTGLACKLQATFVYYYDLAKHTKSETHHRDIYKTTATYITEAQRPTFTVYTLISPEPFRRSSAVALSQRAPSRRVVAATSTHARSLHRSARRATVAYICERPHMPHTVLSERSAMGFEDPYLTRLTRIESVQQQEVRGWMHRVSP